MIEVRVLGSVELVGEDGVVPLGPAKQRRLLAALVIDAGGVRSSDQLIDALWGESPPASAAKLLQIYVSQLRKLLPTGASIRTGGFGYALELEREALDAARFERLLAEGRDALNRGSAALAVSLLRRALALWRGAAYGEFAYEAFARWESERLEELRLDCCEEEIEAELRLGRHAELVPELQALAEAHPLRERLRAQLMLALYRSGRQADSLEVYADTRAVMRDQLGLEPGPELRELERRILNHDPDLFAEHAEAEESSTLPLPANALLGRERELRELRALLLRGDVRLLVLTGAGGTGKTRPPSRRHERQRLRSRTARCSFLSPLRDPGSCSRRLRGRSRSPTFRVRIRPRRSPARFACASCSCCSTTPSICAPPHRRLPSCCRSRPD